MCTQKSSLSINLLSYPFLMFPAFLLLPPQPHIPCPLAYDTSITKPVPHDYLSLLTSTPPSSIPHLHSLLPPLLSNHCPLPPPTTPIQSLPTPSSHHSYPITAHSLLPPLLSNHCPLPPPTTPIQSLPTPSSHHSYPITAHSLLPPLLSNHCHRIRLVCSNAYGACSKDRQSIWYVKIYKG